MKKEWVNVLEKLAVWYLSKRDVSVIIGYEIAFNRVKPKNNKAFIYNNNFTDVNYRNADDTRFEIPEGRFKYLKQKVIPYRD